MSTTLAQGLAMSFLASALWLRRGVCGRKTTPLIVIGLGVIAGMGYIPPNVALWGLSVQKSIFLGPPLIAIALFIAWIASQLVLDDFEVKVVNRQELFLPIYSKLGFWKWNDSFTCVKRIWLT